MVSRTLEANSTLVAGPAASRTLRSLRSLRVGRPLTVIGHHRAVIFSPCISIDSRLSCYMIRSFKDQATEDLFYGRPTKLARRTLPQSLWRQGGKKLDALAAADILEDLRIPPGNRLEVLKGDRKGEHSIRINDQYRICFRWTPNGPEDVQIVDYH